MKKNILIFLALFLASCTNPSEELTTNLTVQEEIPQKTILALWDSITAWYNLEISKSYPSQLEKKLQENWYNYKVINAWVSGDTSAQALDRIWIYLDDEIDVAIVTIWWNDWLRWQDLKAMKSNIEEIISVLEEKNIKVVLSWMRIPMNLWLKYSNDFQKTYEEISENNENIAFFPYFLEWVWGKPKLNLSDRIHPNEAWYDIISTNILEFLEEEKIITK